MFLAGFRKGLLRDRLIIETDSFGSLAEGEKINEFITVVYSNHYVLV